MVIYARKRSIYLHIQEENRSHDFQHSKSTVGKPHFFLQTFPMNPTYYYHAMDTHLHKKGHQQTAQPVLLLGLSRNESKSGLSQTFDQDPLKMSERSKSNNNKTITVKCLSK